MRRSRANLLPTLLAFLFVAALAGCDTLEGINPFDSEKEASGLVEEVGPDYLVVEALRYEVNADTEFEGVDGLADIAIGTEVEIEYEEEGASRVAREIEVGEDDD